MTFFDINNIAFEIIGYKISYVESIGTLFGLLSVYFATKANILTWSTGIINELFLFILFFQVQLYADMFLQVYFFVVTIYGWYNWKQKPKLNSITSTNLNTKIWLASGIIVGTIIAGFLFANIHLYLPHYFKTKAAFPFADSFVMVLSIISTVLLAQKKMETWYLWFTVDMVCVFLFFKKGIAFLALEYLVFLGLATYGLLNWKKQLHNG
ncbi:MAG: nicotinamide riboside transporter PnuC [Chitinophagaceae bacterium]|nr:MAG: nicotinamide riboside transporter PnuC [Chitinophagaceae bacterium]